MIFFENSSKKKKTCNNLLGVMTTPSLSQTKHCSQKNKFQVSNSLLSVAFIVICVSLNYLAWPGRFC